jgi:DNA-binding GntR family transcriptional regulator
MEGERSEVATRNGQNVMIVHDLLRQEILRGNIPAGEASQASLARRLGVGRTPLREAIRMLQREGLIISEPNRRPRIAELTAADAEELYVMRIALEGVAVRITVPRLGSPGVAELEGLMAQMDHYMRLDDFAGFRAPHHAFHERLVAAAGERVTGIIAQLFDHAERYRVNFGATHPEIWDQRRAEHRGIVDACAEGDADLAVRRLVEHYARTASLVFKGLGGGYDPARLRITCAVIASGAERAPEAIASSIPESAGDQPGQPRHQGGDIRVVDQRPVGGS